MPIQNKEATEGHKKIDGRSLKALKVSLSDFTYIVEGYLSKCAENNEVPFLGEVALLCGIDRHTLWEYKEKPGYGSLIKKIEQIGENLLFRKVANGNGVNANQMFLLKAKYGYSETSKMDITTGGKSLGVVMLPKRG